MRFTYNPGDLMGPRNTLFLERTHKEGRREWMGRFQCAICNSEFSARISSIATGSTQSCGCLKQITMRAIGQQNKGQSPPNLKYKEGDYIGPYKTLVIKFTRRSQNGTRLGIFKCSYCGNEFNADTYNISSGHTSSCGCINSKGEQKIMNLLLENNINFISQKTFDDCRGEKQQFFKFDFFLPDYNLVIEYDGEQHFNARESGYFTKDKLLQIQANDRIKDKYCFDAGIKIIRIPYTEYENITWKYLKEKINANN